MDTINIDQLRRLAAIHATPAVSITLPTHVVGEAGLQDTIVLKKLVAQAEDQLAAQGMRRVEARELLTRVDMLPNDAEFWTGRSDGLVVYLSANLFRTYRLPLALSESCTVSRRLNIKPLLPAVDCGKRYLVLVLSQNHLQLFEATSSGIHKVTVKGLPRNKQDALQLDGVDRGQQVHMGMRGGPSKQAAVFHGQGGEKDTAKSDLEQFFRVADRALKPLLSHESAPLLLAGVDYVLPIFRQTCCYPQLMERHLTGNFNLLTNQQLHQQSWEIMREFFDRPRREALQRLRGLLVTGKASADSAEVATAATTGKIDVLLADVKQEQSGEFDPKLGRAVVRSESCDGSEDLVNFAIVETLLHGGTVFSAAAHELPDKAAVGAIYRY
jgi:Bacterial archaeo-eukaryotic release factor family 3